MSGVEWHRVANADGLSLDECRTVRAGPRLIALARTSDGYRALDNRCLHVGGPLGQGSIEGEYLVCPWHGRAYHLHTGECMNVEEKVETFPVEVRNDGVYVAIKS